MNRIHIRGCWVTAQAGWSLTVLCSEARSQLENTQSNFHLGRDPGPWEALGTSHCGEFVVHVGSGYRWVDITELDKYPVGTVRNNLKSAGMILLIWHSLGNVCIPCTPITKIYYMAMKVALRVPFMLSLSGSETGEANGQSSYPWALELAFSCMSSANSCFQELPCWEFAHQNIRRNQSHQGHEHSQSTSGLKT